MSFDEFFNDLIYFLDEIAEIMGSGSSIMSSAAGIASSAVFIVLLALAVLGLVLDIAVYLLRCFPLYKLAKNAGRSDAWLSFIPIAWNFVLCDLSEEPFVLFGKRIFKNRRAAFWCWLAIEYLGPTAAVMISSVAGSILGLFPVVGTALAAGVGMILGLIPAVLTGLIKYRFLYDATEVFRPGHRNNKTLSIASVLVEHFLSTDLLTVVLLWSMTKCKPAPAPQPQAKEPADARPASA